MQNVIELEGITKSYNGVRAIDSVSVSVKNGCITCIIGPNGAGKSTLLRIITGFEFPDKGKVLVNGEGVKNFKYAKRFIAYMPESLTLYPEYYVGELLSVMYKITELRDKELFEFLKLGEIVNKKIRDLSKGWHQRLKLYITLSHKKPVIVLDEPFSGFDPLKMRIIGEIIKKERGERTFLLTTHQLSYAKRICTQYIFLSKGRVVAEGTLTELTEKYGILNDDLEEVFVKAVENEEIALNS